jgi:hypothetical protein
MRAITAAMVILAAGLSPVQAEQSGTGLSQLEPGKLGSSPRSRGCFGTGAPRMRALTARPKSVVRRTR